MDPTQLYETTIYNRDGGEAFSFVTVPTRALAFAAVPPVQELAQDLGIRALALDPSGEGVWRVEPLEAWSIPFFLDGMMGRWGGPEFLREWRFYFDIPNRRGPSQFAQYLTYSPVVPFESSPLTAKSLSELIAGGGASGAVGYLTGHPLFVLYVAAGIIICGGARGIADALRIGARTKLLGWMGVQDPNGTAPPPESEDE